ncbi:MAG: hypothetical protein AAF206_25725 [Bacteroidota bacterium]
MSYKIPFSQKNIFLSFLAACLALVVSSCGKTETVEPTVDEAFSMVAGELVSESFPKASGGSGKRPVVTEVSGNGSVLAGGTNLIRVSFEDPQDDAAFVLVSMEGEDGYYRNEITANRSSVDVTMLLDQALIQEELSLLFSIEDAQGNVSEAYEVPIKRVEAGTGNLQVSLSWDIDNDIDLHLVQPDGEEIYYGNPGSTTGGLLDVDSNPICIIDGIRNENITYDEDAVVLAGEYIVRVDHYAECMLGGQETRFSVVAYLQGDVIAATSGTNPVSSAFASGTQTFGGEGDGVEVMRFDVPTQINKQESDIVVIDYGYTMRRRLAAQNPKVK